MRGIFCIFCIFPTGQKNTNSYEISPFDAALERKEEKRSVPKVTAPLT